MFAYCVCLLNLLCSLYSMLKRGKQCIGLCYNNSYFWSIKVCLYGLLVLFMEGVEDREPPSKRLRLSCAGSSNLSRSSRSGETVAAGSSEDLMAEPIQYQGAERMVGPRGLAKKIEFIRLIAGALYEFGYKIRS